MKKLMLGLVFVWIGIGLFGSIRVVDLHPDEYDYVARGLFGELYFSMDFTNPAWQTYDSYVHEKLPSYVYWWNLKILGKENIYKHNKINLTDSWLKKYTNICDLELYSKLNCQTVIDSFGEKINGMNGVYLSRYLAGSIAFLTLGVFFMIARSILGWWYGLTAVLILSISPLFRNNSLRAMGDVFLLFFLMLTWWLTWKHAVGAIKTKQGENWYVILIGIVLGLAMSSKINGAMGLVAFYVVELFLVLANKKELKQVVVEIVKVGFVMLLVFGLLNPFLWSNPINNMKVMVVNRLNETKQYEVFYPNVYVPDTMSRYRLLIENVTNSQNFGKVPLVMSGVGLISLLIAGNWAEVVALVWVLSTWLIMGQYVSLNWERYYLPMAPVVVLLECLGIKIVIKTIMMFFNNRKLKVNKITVISPHLDDAVLSCGQMISKWVSEGNKVEVITVFTSFGNGFNLPAYTRDYVDKSGFNKIEEFEKSRKIEDVEAMNLLQVGYRHWSYKDAGFRGDYRHRQQLLGGNIRHQDMVLVSEISEKLAMLDTDLLLLPYGVGGHVDHFIVRRAGIMSGKKILYYLESPYLWQKLNIVRYLGLVFNVVSIGIPGPNKDKSLRKYASQYELLKQNLWWPLVEVLVEYENNN